jgi:hypothetical protein
MSFTKHGLRLIAALGICIAALPQQPTAPRDQGDFQYEDIYLREQADQLVFGNSQVELKFGKQQGEWLTLQAKGAPGEMIVPTHAPVAADFRVDDAWMVEKYGAHFERRTVAFDNTRGGVVLKLFLGVGPISPEWQMIPYEWRTRAEGSAERHPSDAELNLNARLQRRFAGSKYAYDFVVEYALFPGESRIERAASVTRREGQNILDSDSKKLKGFLFQLPGVAIGEPSECTLNIPGIFVPSSYVAPGTPYPRLLNRYIEFYSAPEGGFGTFTVSNPRLDTSLGSWMNTRGETTYLSYLSGDSHRITFLHYELRTLRLFKGTTAHSAAHHVQIAPGGSEAVFARYRQMAEQFMPLDPRTPAWAREMVILAVYAPYFPDKIKGLTARLPFYKEVGFNAIWLLPHYLGSYSNFDPYSVDPALGSSADLKEMVRTAHALGMRVIFDMVIHGFNPRSPMVQEHPEFFEHDELGLPLHHATWGTISTDWASPAYQKYMADLTQHDIREYDIDGYRIDAAQYKSPNWDPRIPYEPFRSGAALDLLSKTIAAMREIKPEIVFLSEVWGPLYHSVCNLVHDNQAQSVTFLMEQIEKGQATAADYKLHIADAYSALPDGANRVFYARSADTSRYYHFDGYSHRYLAMEAIHALFGIPEVFAGDPENPPFPDSDPAIYDYYRKLFKLRRDCPELARGRILLREVDCDNPMIFTGIRQLDPHTSVVAISLSDKEETARLSGSVPEGLKWIDAITGAPVAARGKMLNIKPFQVLLGRN